MRSSLFIAPDYPMFTHPDGVQVVAPNYKVLRQLNVALPIYGGQFLIHGAPGTPPTVNATLVIHDGLTDWHWGDLLSKFPIIAKFFMRAVWTKGTIIFDGSVIGHIVEGTMSDYTKAGASVTATLGTNLAGHEWFGDGQ